MFEVEDATDGDARALPPAMIAGSLLSMTNGVWVGGIKDRGPRVAHGLPILVERRGLEGSRRWMLMLEGKTE